VIELWVHLANSESAPRFSTTYEGLHWVNISTMGDGTLYQNPKRDKMRLKLFACGTGKYHSAYSPSALNELNLALTQ
jgi:hypothetical protein